MLAFDHSQIDSVKNLSFIMASYQLSTKIIRNEELSAGVIRLTLEAPEIAACAKPGQFVMVKASDSGIPLLRRPFSIHQVASNGMIQIGT